MALRADLEKLNVSIKKRVERRHMDWKREIRVLFTKNCIISSIEIQLLQVLVIF